MPTATVLIPTHDHGALVQRSVRSALNQSVSDIEVVIVGDGISDDGRTAAREMVELDERVRFVDAAKGERNGELTRHGILRDIEAGIVCYLSDDDLFLPNHVEVMLELLADADFAHALPVYVEPDGSIGIWTVDLTLDGYRDLLLLGRNRIPLSAAAHTLDAYHRLRHGWRTTPLGTPTDLYMWQQFLVTPGMRFASSSVPTMVNFPSPSRRTWSHAERFAELDAWSRNVADSAWRTQFVSDVLALEARDRVVANSSSEISSLASVKRFPRPEGVPLPFARTPKHGGPSAIGYYDPESGFFDVLEPVAHRFRFGPAGAGMLPICGDWNGDGHATIGLYDPAASVFFLRNVMAGGHADVTLSFGPGGRRWVALAGDWNGSGRDSIGLYDPDGGVFHLRAGLEPDSPSKAFGFGGPANGCIPVAGDWCGIGADRVGLYDPSSGSFTLRHELASGVADEVFRFGPMGQDWLPFAARWTGNPVDAVGLFAATIGNFYLRSGGP